MALNWASFAGASCGSSNQQIEEADHYFMQLALRQAEQAFVQGEVPVGAVLIHQDQIIATGFNRREAKQDPLAHAEMLAIRKASRCLRSWRLTGTTLYVTLEPCAMCAGAIIQARVSRVVFGAADPKAGACGSLYHLLADPRVNHRVAVTGGILAEPSRTLLKNFFLERRRFRAAGQALA
ncbi:MAG: tRNA adenosine(34) deaminase TadA [Nitrospirae bacterium]|nr:MAG: tRNA adenosine(34) deaminase TadA [Nitrospirota bacterium]